MAVLKERWWKAQLPARFLENILPCGVVSFERVATSL
jgi:hypothetical protein